ncbi:sialidase-2-like [Salarias fasciatus]|uniref:exo-alpha-sialidase n=1 Tax=Salarias fasciatus TaxID=181472 RepID=A0A672GZF5_SALFA|nr:sialidase-2-like [Salarias fasciatus]
MDNSKADLASRTLQNELSGVFKSTVFRIPSLLYERESKTLLAFAEERKTASDASAEKLVMRRGMLKDCDGKKNVEWTPSKPVNEAKIDGCRPMNPCPVYDKNSKTLFLFFVCIEGTFTDHDQKDDALHSTRLCFVTSDDLGETWSSLTNLTDTLPEIKQWAAFAVGPGHGLQTEKGRLIVPLYASNLTSSSHSCFKPASGQAAHARCLYSDDGKQWKLGTGFETPSGECEMAEFFDGGQSVIYCNARNKGPYRVEALSADNGESFEILSGGTLVETYHGCQGSVVAFPAQTKESHSEGHSEQKQNQWLLFSHPTNKTKRRDLGVYLNKSPRDPTAWSKPLIINKGPSGYSDLAYVEDGWFVCLVECGKVSEVEQIGCKVFHYSQINKHSDTVVKSRFHRTIKQWRAKCLKAE